MLISNQTCQDTEIYKLSQFVRVVTLGPFSKNKTRLNKTYMDIVKFCDFISSVLALLKWLKRVAI